MFEEGPFDSDLEPAHGSSLQAEKADKSRLATAAASDLLYRFISPPCGFVWIKFDR